MNTATVVKLRSRAFGNEFTASRRACARLDRPRQGAAYPGRLELESSFRTHRICDVVGNRLRREPVGRISCGHTGSFA